MYFWLWQRLPGRWPAKLVSSALLVAGVVAALLLVVFPQVEPLLPFQRVTVDAPSAPSMTPMPTPTPTPATAK